MYVLYLDMYRRAPQENFPLRLLHFVVDVGAGLRQAEKFARGTSVVNIKISVADLRKTLI